MNGNKISNIKLAPGCSHYQDTFLAGEDSFKYLPRWSGQVSSPPLPISEAGDDTTLLSVLWSDWSTYLEVEVRSEEFACSSLVLYGIRAHIIGPFSAWKPPIPCAIKNQRGASKDPSRGLWMPKLVLYGIRELAQATL